MNGGFKIQLQLEVVRVTFKFSDAIAAATPISYPNPPTGHGSEEAGASLAGSR